MLYFRLLYIAACVVVAHTAPTGLPDLYEASISDLSAGLNAGYFTSVDLVKAYLARIDEVNRQGPQLHAVIETGPYVLEQAYALDQERAMRGPRGPLHGIPILLKDNIATQASDGMNTTAGSFALLGSVVPRDADVAARLRAAGAVLLGKANLSEWSAFRGRVPSGFSGRGGQATSPYVPNVDPSGSSSGSAIAAAIGLAAATLGTETDGSIVSPSSRNNVVGLKPTVGLTSRAGVIPISYHQDSVGPICRTVSDVALVLSYIAGGGLFNNTLHVQREEAPNYLAALRPGALQGARLGVPRKFQGGDAPTIASFNAALDTLRKLGATIVDPAELPDTAELLASRSEATVLTVDLKLGVNAYLASLVSVPTGVRKLADLIAFNIAHAAEELIKPFYVDQSQFVASEASSANAAYAAAVKDNEDLGRRRGIDAVLAQYGLDALIAPTDSGVYRPAAIAGYPVISVPLGFQPQSARTGAATPTIANAPGVPFGLAFIGPAFSEQRLLALAYGYEQATQTRLQRRAFAAAVPKTQLADVIGR